MNRELMTSEISKAATELGTDLFAPSARAHDNVLKSEVQLALEASRMSSPAWDNDRFGTYRLLRRTLLRLLGPFTTAQMRVDGAQDVGIAALLARVDELEIRITELESARSLEEIDA